MLSSVLLVTVRSTGRCLLSPLTRHAQDIADADSSRRGQQRLQSGRSAVLECSCLCAL